MYVNQISTYLEVNFMWNYSYDFGALYPLRTSHHSLPFRLINNYLFTISKVDFTRPEFTFPFILSAFTREKRGEKKRKKVILIENMLKKNFF